MGSVVRNHDNENNGDEGMQTNYDHYKLKLEKKVNVISYDTA
jgi:hypothetical protein